MMFLATSVGLGQLQGTWAIDAVLVGLVPVSLALVVSLLFLLARVERWVEAAPAPLPNPIAEVEANVEAELAGAVNPEFTSALS